mmetsp:Transcript_4462/g.5840  ORF Transcript_4462/g.5840 Transcript_4462/m.5840 type:complete len:82 (+) Transcript_4462:348-593(+)
MYRGIHRKESECMAVTVKNPFEPNVLTPGLGGIHCHLERKPLLFVLFVYLKNILHNNGATLPTSLTHFRIKSPKSERYKKK